MISDLIWQTPPSILPLQPGQIQIWRVAQDVAPSGGPDERLRLQQLLSDAELGRAQRFHFDRDRHRYIVRHGVLRILLGRLLHQDPAAIRFTIGEYGKPMISAEMNPANVQFNLSHAGKFSLIGLVLENELGVDIERIRPEVDYEGIASRYFGPLEKEQWGRISAEARSDAFFNAWTRKEAFIKTSGKGLAIALDSFDVVISAEESPRLLRVDGDPREHHQWALYNLTPGTGYVGAAAIRDHHHTLQCWQWPAA